MQSVKRLILFFSICLLVTGTYSCSDKTTGSGDNNEVFNSKAAPGNSAHAFLSGQLYTRLDIEIDYMEGYKPTEEAQNNLIDFLQTYLNKTDIEITALNAIPAGEENTYTDNMVRSLEEQYRDHYTDVNSSTLYAYILIVDGAYSDSNVLGIAYYNTSTAFFGKTIANVSGDPPANPSKEKIEKTVFRHEFGHLLGLVNNGSSMQTPHQDEANGEHCDNENCLMYYSVQTGDFFSNLNDSIPALDANCQADLKANGGK